MTVDISGHVAGRCETAGYGLGDESVVVLVSIRHVPINLPLVELLRHFPQHNAHICRARRVGGFRTRRTRCPGSFFASARSLAVSAIQ